MEPNWVAALVDGLEQVQEAIDELLVALVLEVLLLTNVFVKWQGILFEYLSPVQRIASFCLFLLLAVEGFLGNFFFCLCLFDHIRFSSALYRSRSYALIYDRKKRIYFYYYLIYYLI